MTDSQFDESMVRLLHGEKDSLKSIYQDYKNFIFSIMYSVTASRENAEDLVADFFIKLWEQADKYKPGTGHKAWMSRIAHNMAIDFIRKRKRETLTDDFETASNEDSGYNGQSSSESITQRPVEDEVVSNLALKQAFEALSVQEREVLNMKIVADMTFKNIAEVLGISMGVVTWRYQSALKKLRKTGYE